VSDGVVFRYFAGFLGALIAVREAEMGVIVGVIGQDVAGPDDVHSQVRPSRQVEADTEPDGFDTTAVQQGELLAGGFGRSVINREYNGCGRGYSTSQGLCDDKALDLVGAFDDL
jgi:hypothetical protein